MYSEKGVKYLTVKQLRDLIADLDGDLLIFPNRVGNLAVNNPQGEFVGYVDLGNGQLHMEGEEPDEVQP